MRNVERLRANIPIELQSFNQWVCWRAEENTKIPYQINGKLANVNDPNTYSSFDAVCSNIAKYTGIGFVFTNDDPYTFIDLDATTVPADLERQLKIFREFDSYSEISPSGKGLHIICKGSIPQGRRRNHIEIYSSGRYATMTGNIYNQHSVIKDCPQLVMSLWEQMGSVPTIISTFKGSEQVHNDEEIIHQARTAANADKFEQLYTGKWNSLYPSQSEADFALINILSFFTQSTNQIERIFRSSALGKRDKAKRRDYISWMINRSFDRILPPVDIDGFKIQLEAKVAHKQEPEPTVAKSDVARQIPPGLLGELAQFIYSAAPRPVPEVALAAAIGLMAGICGRAYNISGTGLNQYVLLIAPTGSGKEAAASGIDKLMNEIRFTVPTSTRFIGPSEIASGQALIKHLSKVSTCFVSILGEFGLRLQSMSSQYANSAEVGLRRMLLDLFNKSGHGQVFRPMIYADRDKNIEATEAPAFSILGESTPERFYGALNEEMISEGLLPRFMLIEYNGPRPPLSPQHLLAKPNLMLIEKFSSLVANAEVVMHNKRVINVGATPEATVLEQKFDKYADAQINGTNREVLRQLWNRAHIKALKIAALIAVGINMSDPVITVEHFNWAVNMVMSDIKALSEKFEAGEVGSSASELKQHNEVRRMFKEFITRDWEYISKYCELEAFHKDKVVPYRYINKRLSDTAAFRKDTVKPSVSIKRVIQTMLDGGEIVEVNKQQMAEKYKTAQKAYVIADVTILN